MHAYSCENFKKKQAGKPKREGKNALKGSLRTEMQHIDDQEKENKNKNVEKKSEKFAHCKKKEQKEKTRR